MKKRVISVFIVFILCFSFPIVSSAAYDPLDFFVEHLELTFEQISSLLNSDGKHGPSKDHLKSSSSHRSNFDKSSSSGDFVNALTYTFSGSYGDVTFSRDHILNEVYKNDKIDVSGYKWLTVYGNDSSGDYIITYFFPQNTNCKLHITRSDYENHTFDRYANPYSYLTDFDPVMYAYCYGSGFYIRCFDYPSSGWFEKVYLRGLLGDGVSDPMYIMYNDLQSEFIDGDDSSLYHWESQITQTGNDVRTTIACILDDPDQRDSIDLSGYSCSSGIVYHDPSGTINGYPSSDYFYFNSATVNYPEPNVIFKQTLNFNLKDLENYRKRNRLDSLDNFYIFTQVMDSDYETVHYRQQLVNWSLVDDGIFSDVEELPPYEPPEPSPFPDFPDFTFDYTPAAAYNTYNYQTINNYDTTQNFNEWMGDTLTTINNNISGGMDTIDHNIKATGDNITQYFEEIKNFIEGGFSDVNEYLGELIKKFNNDFNDWTVSFADYLHDLFDGLQKNLNIIADNIIEAIQLQTVPDKDVVFNICKSNLPMFDEFSSLFSDHDVSDSELIVAIPYLSNDNANGIELVTRELNSDGAVEVSRTLNSSSFPSLDGYYVFNVTATLTDPRYDFSKFRTVGSLIILGSTLFTLFNITLKCFGMHFGSLSSDDSGAKDS